MKVITFGFCHFCASPARPARTLSTRQQGKCGWYNMHTYVITIFQHSRKVGLYFPSRLWRQFIVRGGAIFWPRTSRTKAEPTKSDAICCWTADFLSSVASGRLVDGATVLGCQHLEDLVSTLTIFVLVVTGCVRPQAVCLGKYAKLPGK